MNTNPITLRPGERTVESARASYLYGRKQLEKFREKNVPSFLLQWQARSVEKRRQRYERLLARLTSN